MRFLVAVVLLPVQLATAATTIATCNRNNCLRAIIATKVPGSADCSSFLDTTITPSTITVAAPTGYTSTVTLTETALTDFGLFRARNAAPTPPLLARQAASTPTYASACSGVSAYSSACSCIGIGPATTTLPTPTYTYTETYTRTICANPLPTFALKLYNTTLKNPSGENLENTFANIDNGDGELIGFNGSPPYGAALFSLNAQGNIVMNANGLIGYTDPGQEMELLHFDSVANVYASEAPALCALNEDQYLSCTTGPGIDILQLCPGRAITNDVFIGEGLGTGCVTPIFYPLAVCDDRI